MEPSLYSLFVLSSDRFTFEVKFLGTFSSELFALDGFKHEFVKELKGNIQLNEKLLNEKSPEEDGYDKEELDRLLKNEIISFSKMIEKIENCNPPSLERYLQIINSDKEYLYIKSLGLIDVHIKEHRVNETFNQNFRDIVQYRDINYGK